MIRDARREQARFLRFSIVGATGALVDFGVFNLAHLLLGLAPVLSSILSFCTAVVSNFLGNRFWTYPESRSKPVPRQLTQFALVNLAGLAIRTPIFVGLEGPFRRMFAALALPLPVSASTLGHNLALAVAILLVMLWNFFVNRYWTYNDVR